MNKVRRTISGIQSRIGEVYPNYMPLPRDYDYATGLIAYAVVHVSVEDVLDPDFDLPSELDSEFAEQFKRINLSRPY